MTREVDENFHPVVWEHVDPVREQERRFWEQSFCALLASSVGLGGSALLADKCLEEWRKRWAK